MAVYRRQAGVAGFRESVVCAMQMAQHLEIASLIKPCPPPLPLLVLRKKKKRAGLRTLNTPFPGPCIALVENSILSFEVSLPAK